MRRRRVATDLPDGALLGLECGHHGDVAACDSDCPACMGAAAGGGECLRCDHRRIPVEATLGRRTPTFDRHSVPPALLRDHLTSAWAELVVMAGEVQFIEPEADWQSTATPERSVVIVPGRKHRIEPSADARFHVQFHDLDRGASAR